MNKDMYRHRIETMGGVVVVQQSGTMDRLQRFGSLVPDTSLRFVRAVLSRYLQSYPKTCVMSHPEKPILEAIDAPWSTALVLICSECDGGKGIELTQALKDEMKVLDHKKDVRVARVRCLGICPKRGVAVTVSGMARTTESYVVNAKDQATVHALCAVILGSHSR